MKKISIITINFNNYNGLVQTTKSVINQDFRDFEYIIIDGGSNDGSKEYISSINENVDYWVSEPDNGIYNALNKGIEKATGEYLLFLNSGDYFINNKVLSENETCFNNFDLIYFDIFMGNTLKRTKISYPNFLNFNLFYQATICHQAIFFKNELFSKYGNYNEQLKFISDWEFLIKTIFIHQVSYKHINDSIVLYDDSGYSSNSSNYSLMQDERNKVLREILPGFIEDYTDYNIKSNFIKKFKLNFFMQMFLKFKKAIKKH